MAKCKVYTLIDPRLGQVFYVGQTRCNPNKRLRFHYKALNQKLVRRESLSPVLGRIKLLRDMGLKPEIAVIDHEGIWDISEAVWIDRLRSQGARLLNVMSIVRR